MTATAQDEFLFLPLGNAVSRAQERRADRFALTLTRNPEAFVTAMRRLAQMNLAEDRPSALARLRVVQSQRVSTFSSRSNGPASRT